MEAVQPESSEKPVVLTPLTPLVAAREVGTVWELQVRESAVWTVKGSDGTTYTVSAHMIQAPCPQPGEDMVIPQDILAIRQVLKQDHDQIASKQHHEGA